MLLDIPAQITRFSPTAFGEGQITMQVCYFNETHEHFIEEKCEPDAFAFAVFPHHVHAVIPVTGADERQAMFPKSEAPQDSSDAVIVKAGLFFRPAGVNRNTSPPPHLSGGL